MIKQTHRSFGALATATYLVAHNAIASHNFFIEPFGLFTSGLLLGAGVLASTWPDIDRKVGIKHRGWTHAIWFPLFLLWLSLTPLIGPLFMAFFMGYMSHLIGDAFSIAGVAFLYPFTGYKETKSGGFVLNHERKVFKPLYRVGQKYPYRPDLVYWSLAVWVFIYAQTF